MIFIPFNSPKTNNRTRSLPPARKCGSQVNSSVSASLSSNAKTSTHFSPGRQPKCYKSCYSYTTLIKNTSTQEVTQSCENVPVIPNNSCLTITSEKEIEITEPSKSSEKVLQDMSMCQPIPPARVCDSSTSMSSQSTTRKEDEIPTSRLQTPKWEVIRKPPPIDRKNRKSFEIQFFTKKKRLSTMKKELIEKQKSMFAIYTSMADIRDKIMEATGKDLGPIEDFKLVDAGNLRRIIIENELAAIGDQHIKQSQTDGAGEDLNEPNHDFMQKLEGKLQNSLHSYTKLCQEALQKRNDIYDWVQNLKINNKIVIEDKKLQDQFEEYGNDGNHLSKQLEETNQIQFQMISETVKYIKILCQNKLLNGENSKQEIDLTEKVYFLEVENTELVQKLKCCTEELENERAKSRLLRDQKSSLDIQLKSAYWKLKELEQKITSDENKIAQLISQLKNFEGYLKIRDNALEQKTKEIQKINKMATEHLANLERQRDGLESRVHDLKISIVEKEKEAADKEKEASNTISELRNKLQETMKQEKEERQLRINSERELKATAQRMIKVEEKSRQLAEMTEKTKELIVMSDESKHSEREVQLWTELESTRTLLKSAKEEIYVLKEEKAKILEMIKQTATVIRNEDEEGLKDMCIRHNAELIQKCEEIEQLEEQVKKLMASLSSSEEKNSHLNKKLKDYQERIACEEISRDKTHLQIQLSELRQQDYQERIACEEISRDKTHLQIQLSELRQQVLDLQLSLLEVVRQNDKLKEALVHKQLEVEQRDRVMRGQCKMLKVREELIGLLKNKEHQDAELATLQLNLENDENADKIKQMIAEKTEEMIEYHSTLHRKQIQVMHLEELLQKMEEQLKRVQAQRTRQEARITQLEHALEETLAQSGGTFLFA